MSDAERLREVDRWVRYAREDVRAAEMFSERDELPPRIACFHAQQAAEKAIKAIFVFLQVDFPFVHDLNRLRNSLPAGWRIKESQMDLSGLSRWAVEPRYPGDLPDATREDAHSAIERAQRAYEAVLADLKQHGYDPNHE